MIILRSLSLAAFFQLSYSFSIQPTHTKPSSISFTEIYFPNEHHPWGFSSSEYSKKKIIWNNEHILDSSSSRLYIRRAKYDFEEDDDDYYDDDEEDEREYEYARVRRSGRRGRYIDDDYDDEEDFDEIPDRGRNRVAAFLSDEEDDEEFDLDDLVENMDFSVTIPNPILDNADPDGATDRMGELVPDRVFWRDMSIMGVLIWIWAASSPDSFVGGHDWMNI